MCIGMCKDNWSDSRQRESWVQREWKNCFATSRQGLLTAQNNQGTNLSATVIHSVIHSFLISLFVYIEIQGGRSGTYIYTYPNKIQKCFSHYGNNIKPISIWYYRTDCYIMRIQSPSAVNVVTGAAGAEESENPNNRNSQRRKSMFQTLMVLQLHITI
jgi:hypothetical protein